MSIRSEPYNAGQFYDMSRAISLRYLRVTQLQLFKSNVTEVYSKVI